MTPQEQKKYTFYRRCQCYHEAGHLVYGLLHRQVPLFVEVPPDLSISYVKWDDTIPLTEDDRKKEALAGPATECYFCFSGRINFMLKHLRNHTLPREVETLSDDLAICADMSDDELADYVEKTFTEQYFEENGRLIKEFAEYLGRNCCLNTDEINKIFKR